MRQFLDFERPLAELELKIDELRKSQEPGGIDIEEEIRQLEGKTGEQLRAIMTVLNRGHVRSRSS